MTITTYLIVFLSTVSFLAGETHYVGSGGRFARVQDAIDVAADGDTIVLLPGRYAESSIIVRKPLYIKGMDGAILDGDNKNEIMVVAARDVTVYGISFVNTGRSSLNDLAAVKGLDARNLTIRKCSFQNTFFAVHVSNAVSLDISDNVFVAKPAREFERGNGIHLWQCDSAMISNNSITGHRDGIYFEFVTNSTIRDNVSDNNARYGLHFMFSHHCSYTNNMFRNNGAGVAVMYTTHVIMRNNVFGQNHGASAYGMLLKDIRDSEVTGNRFSDNSTGIYMEGTSRTTFVSNLFTRNGWALRLQASCDGNSFTGNNFIANTFDVATNGRTVLNAINGNYWDRYTGYDLSRDGIGDVPHHPVSLFSIIVERIPPAIMLWRSLLITLLDIAERIVPAVIPADLRDDQPSMRPHDLG